MSINGMDCMCEAQYEGECACGCDWTTPKEARLEALNAELLAACELAMEIMDRNDESYSHDEYLVMSAAARRRGE